MNAQPPVVLEGITLPAFMQYILKKHAPPSTLIICSTKEDFLRQLHDANSPEAHPNPGTRPTTPQYTWTTLTLRLLASCRGMKVVFCPDLPHLRAYLASYAHRAPADQDIEIPQTNVRRSTRILAILNLMQLHQPTSAFSAQGLNRTLATAVEGAYNTGSRLILAECPTDAKASADEDINMGFGNGMDFRSEDAAEARATNSSPTSPWDVEVSILNVTTKSFGAGERGWVGRTVKVRTIAERWCSFQDIGVAGD